MTIGEFSKKGVLLPDLMRVSSGVYLLIVFTFFSGQYAQAQKADFTFEIKGRSTEGSNRRERRAQESKEQIQLLWGAEKKQSHVDTYLTKRLSIEDPSRFNLTLALADAIQHGLRLAGNEAAGDMSSEAVREALLKIYSTQSARVIADGFRALGLPTYNNIALIGPSGVGKTHTINQLVAMLSFGVIPDFLKEDLGITENYPSPSLERIRNAFFGKTQIVRINQELLGYDNTREGQAWGKADTREKQVLNELMNEARRDFRENGVRTLFVLEEAQTLSDQAHQALKSLLDSTGFVDGSDPIEQGKESGYSLLLVTTVNEYREIVARDRGLATDRRYVPVTILEPNETEALEIVKKTRDRASARHELKMDDSVLEFLISMRKFFAIPPTAMPGSIIKIVEELFSWSADYRNRQNPDTITEDAAYRFLVYRSKLPADVWAPADGSPPLLHLSPKTQERVVGHKEAIDAIVRKVKTGRVNGFHEVPVFIIMGPTGSGKDTIANSLNSALFGREDTRLNFSLAQLSLSEIFEGDRQSPPRLVQALSDGPPHGVIVLNEAKDAESSSFEILKVVVEQGEIRPQGIDPRERPLGLSAIFIMGQWGEELFVNAKSDEEVQQILDRLSEKDLIEILMRGKPTQAYGDKYDGKHGALPEALIQRSIRSGGILMLGPVPTSRFREIVRLNLEKIRSRVRVSNQTELEVDDLLVDLVVKKAIEAGRGTRGLDGVLTDFTLTAISQSVDRGLPSRKAKLVITADPQTETVIVKHLLDSGESKSYDFHIKDLMRMKCESHLSPEVN